MSSEVPLCSVQADLVKFDRNSDTSFSLSIFAEQVANPSRFAANCCAKIKSIALRPKELSRDSRGRRWPAKFYC